MKDRLAIIDADVCVYRAGYAAQDNIHKVVDHEGDVLAEFSYKKEANDFAEMLIEGGTSVVIETEVIPKAHDDVDMIVNVMMRNIMKGARATDIICYLSGATNFRNDVATIQGYKENRKNSVRPVHYQYIRDYIMENYPTFVSENCEADDLCSMRLFTEFKKAQLSRKKSDCKAILCSIDKDLLNTPGRHYNITKKKIDWVTPKQADKHFALQLLTGDNVDNIPGISKLSGGKKKVGPKTAEKFLKDCKNIKQYYKAICDVYEEYAGDDWHDKLQEVGSLLWMQRSPEQEFDVLMWSKSDYNKKEEI